MSYKVYDGLTSEQRYRAKHKESIGLKAGLLRKTSEHKRWVFDYHIKRNHRMTRSFYDMLVILQCGKCAICNFQLTGHYASIDHNHKTGQIRRILCHNCNVGLGALRDNPVLLRKAADYVEWHCTPSGLY